MVTKDFNHPSVIMYSIGNEIPETGSPAGGLTGRALAEKVRELDPTRYVTNAVNGMLAVMDDIKRLAAQRGQGDGRRRGDQHPHGRAGRVHEPDRHLPDGPRRRPPSPSACSTSPA